MSQTGASRVRRIASSERMRRHLPRNDGLRGFTLVEVLVAVLILSIGMISVLRSYITLMNAVETANFTSDAAYLLKEKMADIEEEAIENPDVSVGTKSGVFAGGPAAFKWETEIVDIKIASVNKGKEGKIGADKGAGGTSLSGTADKGAGGTSLSGTADKGILEKGASYRGGNKAAGTAEAEKENPDKILKKIHISVTENGLGSAKTLNLWTYLEDCSEVSQ